VTAPETPEASSPTAPVETIRKALIGYRIMAWTTGVWLIALCYEMVLKYLVHVDNPPNWIAIVHGWVYFVYLLFTANLAVKVRWPIGKTVGVLLAGTIPLVGIIVERPVSGSRLSVGAPAAVVARQPVELAIPAGESRVVEP
jgi:integral membrane protein